MRRPSLICVVLLSCLTALWGCGPALPDLPPGWPLPQLSLPDGARAIALAKLLPPDRPYYSSGSDEAIKPALLTHARLLAALRENGDAAAAQSVYSSQPVLSVGGDSGSGWGIAYEVPGGGFDYTLAKCERALLPLGYQTVEYVPGMLRVYYSPDRATEVVLVAGRKWQLLLAVNHYDPPLPGEREWAMREDVRQAARELAEAIKTHVLEMQRDAASPIIAD